MRQDACRAVAAAQAHQDFRRFDTTAGNFLEVGGALGIAAGKALVTAAACLLVGHGKACVVEAGQAGGYAVGVFGEA